MASALYQFIEQVSREKGIDPQIVVTAVEDAIVVAESNIRTRTRTGDFNDQAFTDPAVRELLSDPVHGLSATTFEIPLKGFDAEKFNLWRVTRSGTHASGVQR